MAKALSHETRLQIIDVLADKGAHCVSELTSLIGVSQSSVSKHLSILKTAGIVDSRKDGLNVNYYLRIPCVKNFFKCIDTVLYEEWKRKSEELESMKGNISE